jgi:hypothetical protein
LAALEAGRSPVEITERTDHLEALADRLSRFAKNVIILRGGQSERKPREAMERLAAIPEQDERVIVATGRYLGEGFDDQRLDTVFLTMPIAWNASGCPFREPPLEHGRFLGVLRIAPHR